MRLIIAVLRPAQVESVRQALADIQVTRMTMGDAQGHDLGAAAVAQEVVVEIACNDDFVERTLDRITAVLGECPPGRVVVLPIAEAVQLNGGIRGPEAI